MSKDGLNAYCVRFYKTNGVRRSQFLYGVNVRAPSAGVAVETAVKEMPCWVEDINGGHFSLSWPDEAGVELLEEESDAELGRR